MRSFATEWGADSVLLELPAGTVAIVGLSPAQKSDIASDYSSFVVGASKVTRAPDVVCQARQLTRPVGLPIEHFSRDGQYTLQKRRSDSGIEVTGFEFIGELSRSSSTPAQAALSVAEEVELPTSDVLQNFLRVVVAHRALDRGGVLLHSVGVLRECRAYLLVGRSNVGKTTLARKAAMVGARVLSDDINLVLSERGEYRAHKVPFTGEFGQHSENTSGCGSFPLAGLALLEQASELTAAPVSAAAAVAGLLAGCPFVNDDAEELPTLLDVLTRLVSRTPVIRLGVARTDPYEAVMGTMLRCCEHG